MPLASLLGVRDEKRVRAAPNPVLESYFLSSTKHPTQVISPCRLIHHIAGVDTPPVHVIILRLLSLAAVTCLN